MKQEYLEFMKKHFIRYEEMVACLENLKFENAKLKQMRNE